MGVVGSATCATPSPVRPVSSGACSPASCASRATRWWPWSATRRGPAPCATSGSSWSPATSTTPRRWTGSAPARTGSSTWPAGTSSASATRRPVSASTSRAPATRSRPRSAPASRRSSTPAPWRSTPTPRSRSSTRPTASPASTCRSTTAPRPRPTRSPTASPRDGLPVVIVQPGLVYGPGDTAQTGAFIAQVVAGKRPPVPAAGGVCWGHVEDIAAGHVLAMEKGEPGESYMLAGPRATLAEGLQVAARVAGTKGPRAAARRHGPGHRRAARVLGKVVPAAAGLRRGDAARVAGDLLRQPGQGRARPRLAGPVARGGHGRHRRRPPPARCAGRQFVAVEPSVRVRGSAAVQPGQQVGRRQRGGPLLVAGEVPGRRVRRARRLSGRRGRTPCRP